MPGQYYFNNIIAFCFYFDVKIFCRNKELAGDWNRMVLNFLCGYEIIANYCLGSILF
jgi:hypothetical protein